MGFLDRFKKNKTIESYPVDKEPIDPYTGELINISNLVPVATFTYEDGKQTRLIKTKIIKHEEGGTIYLGAEDYVCFEVPASIPIEKIESIGLLESLAHSGAFSNLDSKVYTHLGRFDDKFLRLVPPNPNVLAYVDRNLNPLMQEELTQRRMQIEREQRLCEQKYRESLKIDNNGDYMKRRREQLAKRRLDPSITRVSGNEYNMNDPETGEIIFLKNIEVMCEDIRHRDNTAPTTLYSARVSYKSNPDDEILINEGSIISFELTGTIQDTINRRNPQEIQKLRELFSESHVDSKTVPNRLSFIGRLKEQRGFGFQIEQGTNAVLKFVDEQSRTEKYLPKHYQFEHE